MRYQVRVAGRIFEGSDVNGTNAVGDGDLVECKAACGFGAHCKSHCICGKKWLFGCSVMYTTMNTLSPDENGYDAKYACGSYSDLCEVKNGKCDYKGHSPNVLM